MLIWLQLPTHWVSLEGRHPLCFESHAYNFLFQKSLDGFFFFLRNIFFIIQVTMNLLVAVL